VGFDFLNRKKAIKKKLSSGEKI
jgi:hypothetical protein